MATSDVENNSIAAPVDARISAQADAERVYPMSRAGRRQAILLLLGVASIWVFALWTLITIFEGGVTGAEWVSLLLMIAILVVAPVVAWSLLEEAYSCITTSSNGIRYQTIAGINLGYKWEEVQGFKGREGRGRLARFFLGDEGADMLNTANGVEASEPRSESMDAATTEMSEGGAADAQEMAQSPEATEDGDARDGDEPETTLVRVRDNHAAQIRNPLTRFLHAQAHGRYLPIYGGLENRRQLLDEIVVKRKT